MSCGGSMMRSAHRPLAHLVDAAAEKWLAAESLPADARQSVHEEITASFRLGDADKLTFHGINYVLTIRRAGTGAEVDVHEIVHND